MLPCTKSTRSIIILFGFVASVSSKRLWKDVCTQSDTKDLPFCDMSLSRNERVSDYVRRIDLESKAQMMVNDAAPFHPLHIPAYQWWNEGLHGPLQPCVCDDYTTKTNCKCPTSFPCPSAMAAAFNNTLYHLVGQADGREGRAINNLRNRATQTGIIGDGIDYWSPTINMQRDPRWGRNQEVPGEDPMLTGQYAVNFVKGLQEGEDPNYVQIVATCKHFVANSMENWKGYTRNNFDATVSKADLANYYMPAFRDCVMKGKGLGIMCSYNSVNGKPACANEWLLDTTLRDTWGFTGYVTSDCGAIDLMFQPEPYGHGYTTDAINATALAIHAGTDVNCGSTYSKFIYDAVRSGGPLTERQVDKSFSRLVHIQMRLGLFDANKDSQPYYNYGANEIDTAAHQRLALEAAHQSIVLLKNDGGVLPLSSGRNVAVIGPHFNSTEAFLSNYYGSRCRGNGGGEENDVSCIVTPLAAISVANAGGNTTFALGCDVNSTNDFISDALATASTADVVVLLVGIDNSIEREGQDRINTTLPGLQIELVTHILALNKPTVLVLVSGGTMSLGPIKDSAPAIISAAYGGERASEAIADVLYGSYNPSGKLAATMYPPEYVNEIPMTEMGLQVSPGRTHMFFSGKPEFSFGHGLSYTTWGLSWSKDREQSKSSMVRWDTTATSRKLRVVGKILNFDIKVSNTGKRSGRQTIILFMIPKSKTLMDGSNGLLPLRQKVLTYNNTDSVLPGEHRVLRFQVDTLGLAMADVEGNMMVTAGEYDFVFRDGQNQLRHSIIVNGPPIMVQHFPIKDQEGPGIIELL